MKRPLLIIPDFIRNFAEIRFKPDNRQDDRGSEHTEIACDYALTPFHSFSQDYGHLEKLLFSIKTDRKKQFYH
jgi:hypothetical protein